MTAGGITNTYKGRRFQTFPIACKVHINLTKEQKVRKAARAPREVAQNKEERYFAMMAVKQLKVKSLQIHNATG